MTHWSRGEKTSFRALSIEWMAFVLPKCVSLSLFPVFVSSNSEFLLLLQCRVSTVIPAVQRLPGDSDRGKQCLFLFWLLPFLLREESHLVADRKTQWKWGRNQAKRKWCHFYITTTLYFPHYNISLSKQKLSILTLTVPHSSFALGMHQSDFFFFQWQIIFSTDPPPLLSFSWI